MMGSLRNPAGFCNVYGFRPTWGLVPSDAEGDTYLSTLATEGPMARTVEDVARLLAGAGGREPRGALSPRRAGPADGAGPRGEGRCASAGWATGAAPMRWSRGSWTCARGAAGWRSWGRWSSPCPALPGRKAVVFLGDAAGDAERGRQAGAGRRPGEAGADQARDLVGDRAGPGPVGAGGPRGQRDPQPLAPCGAAVPALRCRGPADRAGLALPGRLALAARDRGARRWTPTTAGWRSWCPPA
jgi:hypothetical protein